MYSVRHFYAIVCQKQGADSRNLYFHIQSFSFSKACVFKILWNRTGNCTLFWRGDHNITIGECISCLPHSMSTSIAVRGALIILQHRRLANWSRVFEPFRAEGTSNLHVLAFCYASNSLSLSAAFQCLPSQLPITPPQTRIRWCGTDDVSTPWKRK